MNGVRLEMILDDRVCDSLVMAVVAWAVLLVFQAPENELISPMVLVLVVPCGSLTGQRWGLADAIVFISPSPRLSLTCCRLSNADDVALSLKSVRNRNDAQHNASNLLS
jgi:hypothetical protein